MGLRRVKKLTIDRSKWNRGANHEARKRGLEEVGRGLLDPVTGGMCCLGFLTKACGASVKGDSIEDVKGHPPESVAKLYGLDSLEEDYPWDDFTYLNDGKYNEVCSPEREKELTKLFKEKLNIDVNFVGETPRHPSHR